MSKSKSNDYAQQVADAESRHQSELASLRMKRRLKELSDERRAKLRAQAAADKAAMKESAEFRRKVLPGGTTASPCVLDAGFDGTQEGTYWLELDSGIRLEFSAQGDECACATMTIVGARKEAKAS